MKHNNKAHRRDLCLGIGTIFQLISSQVDPVFAPTLQGTRY